MGIAVKVVVGLALLLPMTAYVVGSLVAAADEPQEHAPIIVQEQAEPSEKPRSSPSEKPSEKPGGDKSGRGDDGPDDHDSSHSPEIVTPSPDDLFDDHGGDDNSGKGSGGDDGDDNSGKGSGSDDD